jgi:endonuclease/exonuclease/phosphatase family metal-dependent hydrolase
MRKLGQKKNKRKRIFQRDCLEIVLDLKGTEVSVFNCHFKSMGGDKNRSFAIRQLEAVTVHEIINRKFDNPAKAAEALWAVVGDLNDAQKHIFVSRKKDNPEEIRKFSPSHSKKDSEKEELGSGIDPLLDDGFGVNLAETLASSEQWSLFYAPKSTKSQLDYVIASPALARRISEPPRFIRKGQPYRVPNTDAVDRYSRIGWDRPKASDHCPLVVEFDIRASS